MSEERVDMVEQLQRLQSAYQKFVGYLQKAKSKPSDTDVEVKSMSFNVGKKGEAHTVNMELDFTLSNKQQKTKEPQETL